MRTFFARKITMRTTRSSAFRWARSRASPIGCTTRPSCTSRLPSRCVNSLKAPTATSAKKRATTRSPLRTAAMCQWSLRTTRRWCESSSLTSHCHSMKTPIFQLGTRRFALNMKCSRWRPPAIRAPLTNSKRNAIAHCASYAKRDSSGATAPASLPALPNPLMKKNANGNRRFAPAWTANSASSSTKRSRLTS